MSVVKTAVRWVGAAFLIVLVASLIRTQLYNRVTGSGDVPQILESVAANASLMRVSGLIGLLTSAGIIVLAVALYLLLLAVPVGMALFLPDCAA